MIANFVQVANSMENALHMVNIVVNAIEKNLFAYCCRKTFDRFQNEQDLSSSTSDEFYMKSAKTTRTDPEVVSEQAFEKPSD